jgi:predicted transcriptional regulator
MEDLVKHLISNGIEEGAASKIAASYKEETIDTDNLQKALDGIAEAMKTTETTTDTYAGTSTVDNTLTAETNVAVDANIVADAVTRGADALLSEVREQNDALAKGLLAIGEEMRAVRHFLNTQHGAVAQVTEQVEAVKKSLNEPLLQKAIVSNSINSPYEETVEAVETSGTLMEKALDELKGSTDDARKATLRKAITQLECGVPMNTVKNQFGI